MYWGIANSISIMSEVFLFAATTGTVLRKRSLPYVKNNILIAVLCALNYVCYGVWGKNITGYAIIFALNTAYVLIAFRDEVVSKLIWTAFYFLAIYMIVSIAMSILVMLYPEYPPNFFMDNNLTALVATIFLRILEY